MLGRRLGLAGLLACALLALVLADNPPWLACAAAGALLSALLVAGLILRARARAPATTTARLAELRGTTVERIGEITSANFTRLFPRVSS